MPNVNEQILSLLPSTLLEEAVTTPKGRLLCPNDDLLRGPKFLIRLNDALPESLIDWQMVTPFFNGGNEALCRAFLGQSNGFSIGNQFVAPGILTQNAHDGNLLHSLNVPYDLATLAYGSYPQFAPNAGYFIAASLCELQLVETCDIITPEGQIIAGRFRDGPEVLEQFDDIPSWLNRRVPQALESMAKRGLLSI